MASCCGRRVKERKVKIVRQDPLVVESALASASGSGIVIALLRYPARQPAIKAGVQMNIPGHACEGD